MRTWVIALLACLACTAPAAAAERVTTIPGAPGPGPSKYDKVFVTKLGPKSANRVLVLMPGYDGGAGDFTLDARELVKRVPGLQVWAVDRRSEALGRVVLSARRQGERVILDGHSLGASMTVAYASWDFGGRPGYKDLDGLVLIDGGLMGSFSTPDLAATKKAIAALDVNGPFADLLGLKLPWTAGVFAEVGALAALKEPIAPSAVQSFPLLPPELKPPIPATNRGAFGFAFDASTSPKALALIHVQAGTLGPNYAVQTDLTGGRVLRGARRFIAGSKVPRSRSVLVDASSDESHLDPLTAAPDRNRFLKTVVPFLRAVR